jgi:hypothetical protein
MDLLGLMEDDTVALVLRVLDSSLDWGVEYFLPQADQVVLELEVLLVLVEVPNHHQAMVCNLDFLVVGKSKDFRT